MAPDYPLLGTTFLRRCIPTNSEITATHTQQRTGVGQERDGHNLKEETFSLDTEKNLFTLRAGKQWSLEVFKTQHDKALCNLVQPQSQPCFKQ